VSSSGGGAYVCLSARVYSVYRLAYIYFMHVLFVLGVVLPLRHPPRRRPALLCASAIPRPQQANTHIHSLVIALLYILLFHRLTQRYPRTPTNTRYCTPDPPLPCLPSSTTRCLALCAVCPNTYHYRPSTPELADPSNLSRNVKDMYANTLRSGECKKCGRILASFIDPSQAFGPDKIIPPSILANAKGLAILTVFKVGFLGSGRFGSGVVVARLSDGTWYVDTFARAGVETARRMLG